MKISYLLIYILLSCTSVSSIQNYEYAEKIRAYVEGGLEIYITTKIEYLDSDFNLVLKTTELHGSFNDNEKIDYQKDFSTLIYNTLTNKAPLKVDKKQFEYLRKYIIEDAENIYYTNDEILNSLDEHGFIKYPYNDLRTKSIIYFLANNEIVVSEGNLGPCVKKELLIKE